MHPTFTVIIVTFKRINHLKKAIASVMCQSLNHYECLIFNDYPQDNKEIAKMVMELKDDRFRFIPSECSKGANHWRNAGVQIAKGEYIAFLDDDDHWFPDKLAEHFLAHTRQEAFLVYSNYIKRWSDTNYPDVVKLNSQMTENVHLAMRNGEFSISTTSSVSLKNQIDWQLFDESLLSFQDWDAWFNLTIVKPNATFYRIDRPLLGFTQHGIDRVSQNYKRRFNALKQIKAKYKNKGVSIRGFLYKEKLNILLMRMRMEKIPKLLAYLELSAWLVWNPLSFQYGYTYKRIGRFLFRDEGKL
jgi:glycosyltransferase involved in cell wall biosynthesis